ncbi:hypothetical protein [Alterinioella nitratireducens]|mgnify:CR=1 FL=1|jgi:hypothetical protein|uniref:hypothetical protein n=1 Tax=Alterinioella nitratireducens TaxID=2735915 RepID=UPI000C65942F|nr:hypothetical protein [Alterinioella nitratireducens]MAN15672.1 hypothetical protein [Dinoroseobacter sp.]MAX74596.1 hypothetical protein [Nioella sp.]NPD20251.1 hypothetical protein [Alterinioella nitratireducens]HCI99361.1 hypothetical protein [Sulfitobacter sp.]|tara:strand:+ start:252 stop:539 length:288 start_codon:yes stop_codon:yes gene_type:complete
MKHALLTLALLGFASVATAANATCYADYKAKMDNPLRLHYGVIELPASACSVGAAAPVISSRLTGGWQLLEVMSVFDESGLDSREARAGQYYLSF